MNKLQSLDTELFLFLNDARASWLDMPMWYLSNTWTWLPLYLLLFYWLYREYGKDLWIIVLGIAITIALSDQLTSGLMKPFFERLRPSRDPSLEGMVHTVNNYRGGLYGFASSHAANTFGTAFLLFMLLRSRIRHLALLFLWAAFVSYTRIYLGVHYPGDIIAGALAGVLCATIVYFIVLKVLATWQRKRANDVATRDSGAS